MEQLFKIIPIILYFIVGVISLMMAIKNLTAKEYLSFHEEAAGKKWEEIDVSLQILIISYLRIIGFGFLIAALLMLICPIVNYFIQNIFFEFAVPVLALIFCSGLFINNYILYKKTTAYTPWKGSLYAVVIIVVGMVISLLHLLLL